MTDEPKQPIEQVTVPVLEAPDRLFQITRASRSHSRVWLQADPSDGHPYRLEVLFQSVQYLCLPFALRGLSLRRATGADRARIGARHGIPLDSRGDIYRLSHDDDAFIVSSGPLWAVADLRHDDDPVYWTYAGRPDVVTVMGKIA